MPTHLPKTGLAACNFHFLVVANLQSTENSTENLGQFGLLVQTLCGAVCRNSQP